MKVEIAFVTDSGRDGVFDPQSGRLEIYDLPDEFGDVYGSNVFAGVRVTSVDGDRVTSELAPGRYVTFRTISGFELEHYVEDVAVIVDGVTVWDSTDKIAGVS